MAVRTKKKGVNPAKGTPKPGPVKKRAPPAADPLEAAGNRLVRALDDASDTSLARQKEALRLMETVEEELGRQREVTRGVKDALARAIGRTEDLRLFGPEHNRRTTTMAQMDETMARAESLIAGIEADTERLLGGEPPSRPTLSIVVPSHEEAEAVESSLVTLFRMLRRMQVAFEVVLVVYGSRDDTAKRARSLTGRLSELRVVELDAVDLDGALKLGLDEARAPFVLTAHEKTVDPGKK